MKNERAILVSALFAVAISGWTDFAVAQTGVGALEEIVVTARRREESLQDVPISIVALTADELELRGVQRMEDLNVFVPNVALVGQGLDDTSGEIIMRGIPGVTTFIDGQWVPGPQGLIQRQVVEVDRVEVLRGPQGTLFGKNSTGGAVHYITRPPGQEFGARVTATIGEFSRQDVIGAVDVPLSDTLLTKWTVASLTRKGFVQSLSVDRKFGDMDNKVLRGDILWQPGENFSLRFNAELNDAAANGPAHVQTGIIEDVPTGRLSLAEAFTVAGLPVTNRTTTMGFPGGDVGEFQTQSAIDRDGWVYEEDRYTLTLDWAISAAFAFKSISGYREVEDHRLADPAATPYTLLSLANNSLSETVTQEFQLIGAHERVEWIAGLYYYEDDAFTRGFRWWIGPEVRENPARVAAIQGFIRANPAGPWPFLFPPFAAQDAHFRRANTEGLAVYGAATIALTDTLELTLGIRSFEEDLLNEDFRPMYPVSRDTYGHPAGDRWAIAAVNQTSDATFDVTTPRLAINYSISENAMIYFQAAEGFGSGGINNFGFIPYDPEEVTNYEVGLRSDWLENRLRVNATVFSTDWENIQVSELVPGIARNIITNAGAATADGIEADLIWLATDNWRFNVSAGLLDTEYTEVGNATSIAPGVQFPHAPESSYSFGAQYDTTLVSGRNVSFRLDYGWLDDYVRIQELNRQKQQEAYGLLNARFNYEPAEGNWRFSMFGTNLTDEIYFNSGFLSDTIGTDVATVGRPRELGATLQFFFD